jgi:hypothetical protein
MTLPTNTIIGITGMEITTPTQKIKRFLLFAGDNHYPLGGWSDLKGSFDTYEEAIMQGKYLELNDRNIYWWHVIDLEGSESQ